MSSHNNTLAILLREDGRLDEALRLHQLAIDHRLMLVEAAPHNRNHAWSLRNYDHDLAETVLVQKDHAAAASKMAKARPDDAADAELAAHFISRCNSAG